MDALRAAWRRHVLRKPDNPYTLAGDGEELQDVERNGKAAAPAGAPNGKGGSSAPPASGASLWRAHKAQLLSLLPYLWPRDEPRLCVCIVFAFAFLVLAKAFNVLVPLALKRAVDALGDGRLPLGPVLCYGAFRFLTDSTKEARDCLYNYAATAASRKISLRVFTHVQNLSLRFHLNRKTGAVMRAVSRGSAAYADLLRYVTFQIAPILLETAFVSTFLFVRYPPAFGIITNAVIVLYVASTIAITEWRNKYRRLATEADDAFNQKAVDALLNFETVMYFCAQDHISGVYDESLKAVADASIDSQLSLSLLNVVQNAVISVGVALAMGLAGREVVHGRMTTGDFVLVQVFILQLYAPLNFLGTYWRMIKAALVDVEAMFKLLAEEQEVSDLPGATDLVVAHPGDATVRFEDVVFTFDPRRGPILRGVTLEAAAGRKLAVLGSSGAGKSTLARLLYRMYNLERGRICIAGADIAARTLRSVRLAVGIVPQDCVLFNDTLRYNVSLGKLARGELAGDDEVGAAVGAAQLAAFVAKQPAGLDTVVGERGLRLSGGEKQRVAIARALLKNPAVLVCDEATSALDSHTEREITAAMDAAASGRTYIVIAHRLSTIADADAIAVLHEGVVAELGTHAELLARAGLYAGMWQRHLLADAKAAAAAAGGQSGASDSSSSLVSMAG